MKTSEVLDILEEVEEIPGFSEYYYSQNFTAEDYGIELCKIAHPSNQAAQALTTIISIAGLLLNCGVIYVMIMMKEFQKTKLHWLVFQLFIANVVFLFFVFLEMVNEHHGRWMMGDTICKLDEATIFASRSAGVLFLVLSNIVGFSSAVGLSFKWLSLCPCSDNKVIQIVKCVLVLLCVWLPSVLVNLPLYRFNNINDCGRCVLEFPIDIGELCKLLSLSDSACDDVVEFFKKGTNATGLDSTVKGGMDWEYFSGGGIDTVEFDKILEDNITEMAEMIICDYEEPGSFFVWLLATFTLFFAIPMPILLVFLCAWIYNTVIRRQRSEVALLRIVFVLDIFFIFCWTPWNAIHMRKAYGGLGKDGYQCASLLHYARLSALMYNSFSPVVYITLTKDFGSRALETFNSSASFCYDILKIAEKPPPEPTMLKRTDSQDCETTLTTTASISDSNESLKSPNSPTATPV